jgi:hypothetical protein
MIRTEAQLAAGAVGEAPVSLPPATPAMLRAALEATVQNAPALVRAGSERLGAPLDGPGAGALWFEGPLRLAALLARLADTRSEKTRRPPRARRSPEGAWELPLPLARSLRAMAPGVRASVRPAAASEVHAPDAPRIVAGPGGWVDALAFALAHAVLEGRPMTVVLDPADGALEEALSAITAPLGAWVHVGVDRFDDARLSPHFATHSPAPSPFVVAPYLFDRASMDHLARMLVSEVVRSVGSPSFDMPVLLVPRGWPQHARVLDGVRERLARVPARSVGEQPLPWSVLDDLGADDVTAFAREPLPGTLLVAAVGPMDDAPAHLREAVLFSNERLLGARSATLLAHPYQGEEPSVSLAIAAALSGLAPSVVGHGIPGSAARLLGLPWGPAFPSWAHALGVPLAKLVLRGSFGGLVRPPTFVDHRAMPRLAPELLSAIARGGLRAYAGAFAASLAA